MPKSGRKVLPLSEKVSRAKSTLAGIQEDISKERSHNHITFIIIHCYTCFILVLVVTVNLLVCLTHKLNFIISGWEHTLGICRVAGVNGRYYLN